MIATGAGLGGVVGGTLCGSAGLNLASRWSTVEDFVSETMSKGLLC